MKKLLERLKRTDYIFYFLIIAVSLLAARPLLRGDFFHFSDEPHIANLYQMVRAIESGQILPRWAPDVSWEYGHPLFNFYYLLPFYVGYIFHLIGFSLISSLKILFFLTIPASGIFMYMWLKKHTDALGAFAGSVIYIFTPYRAVDLYVRGAVGEAVAFVFFPLVSLATYNAFHEREWRNVALLALTSGLFILSHNLAPIIFFPWLFIYALYLSISTGAFKNLKYVFMGFLLGVGISSFWAIPAFFEKQLLVTSTPFNYQDHFPFIKQLIYSPFKYGASNPGPGDDISFQVGVVNWLLIAISSLIFVIAKSKLKRLYFVFLAGILFSLFMMNIRSSFIWEATLLSNYIQFPWRLLMMTTFLTSSLVIFLSELKKGRNKILIILAAASIILNFSYFKPSEYYKPDDNYFLSRFFARRLVEGESEVISQEYKNYSEDYLLLPVWVKEKPINLPSAKFTSGELNIETITRNTSVDYSANVSGSGVLEFNSYYFPGWYATIDRSLTSIEILNPKGNIGITIPEGKHTIRVFWRETPLRLFADMTSLSSVAAVFVLLFVEKKKVA